jgi:hypothetical protein
MKGTHSVHEGNAFGYMKEATRFMKGKASDGYRQTFFSATGKALE